MKFKSFIIKPCVLIFISAILSALPLTFECLFPLSWVSFIPFFYVIIKHSRDKFRFSFGRGILFGFIYHILVYYWFLWFYPLDFINLSGGASVTVVCLAVFGISAVHGALWCLPFALCWTAQKLSKNTLFLSFVAILGAIAAEKITSLSELSFPWARISLGQYKATALIQSASIFGIDGVDMLILIVNALFAICIISSPKKRVIAATAAAVIFVANLGFGLIRLNTAHNGDALTIITVQASVEQSDKWSSGGDKICFDMYSTLTKENITEGIQLVLWPESAVPKVYKSEKSLKKYKKLSKSLDVPILVGVLLKNDGDHTNNATLITKDGAKASYAKRKLVPFGEYMPYKDMLSKIFPVLSDLNIIEDDYVAGNSSEIMQVGGGSLGSIICFESIYPELSRQSVLDGAELLIEVTNDSWLKTSPAMKQHLAHGVFRSIENGRYLVRSANSGISAVIDSRGNVTRELDVNERGVITDTVYFNDEQTLYTTTGDILYPLCCATILVWILILYIKKIKNGR